MTKQLPKPTSTVVLVTLVFLLVAGAVGYSAYLYQNKRQVAPQESYSQLKTERDNAVKHASIVSAVDSVNLSKANQATAEANTKLVAACGALKTTKVTSPVCN